MAVITISREYGSSGGTIAKEVAESLGWRLFDKRKMGWILGDYGLVDFDSEYDTKLGFWAALDSRVKSMVAMLDRVTLAIARQGDAVILGRGAFVVLAGYADVLNVRIQAPFATRVERVRTQEGHAALEKAEAAVRRGDEVRRVFVESMYGVPWNSGTAFDLVLDTGKIPPETAADLIVRAVEAMSLHIVPGSRRTSSIEVDETLARTVASA